MKLRVTRKALNQLHEAADYIRQRNPRAAASIENVFRATFARLEHSPYIGRPSKREGIRITITRRYPYVISYCVNGAEIVVLDIRHGRRVAFEDE